MPDRAELAGSIIESQFTPKTNRLKPSGTPQSPDACKILTQASSSWFRATNFDGDSLTQSTRRLLTFPSRSVESLHTPASVLPHAGFELSYAWIHATNQSELRSRRSTGTHFRRNCLVGWAGQPEASVIFHKQDASLIPFSLLGGGFAIFWEASVAGMWGAHSSQRWTFGMLWGAPFVLIGQYLIWGQFFYAAWLKGRTHYAVTNRRVIVVQEGWKRQMAAAYLDSLPSLIKEGESSGVGILRFGESRPIWSDNRGWGHGTG